ncbi:MAG TPA: hypothetical protein V6D19_02560 [Stenomitos sp.]
MMASILEVLISTGGSAIAVARQLSSSSMYDATVINTGISSHRMMSLSKCNELTQNFIEGF